MFLYIFESERDALHYAVLGLVLLGFWLPLMDFFQSNLILTAGAWFAVLVIADKIIHMVLKV